MQLLSPTDSHPQSLSDLPETSCACAPIVLHMYKKFQVNRTKIKGGCQSETKAAHCYSCTDLTLVIFINLPYARHYRPLTNIARPLLFLIGRVKFYVVF